MRKLLLSAAILLAVFTIIQLVLATPSSGESIAVKRLDEARSAFSEQDWATTAAACEALAAENPYQGEFWYRLGVANYYLKKYEESIAAYRQAADLGYQSGTSYYNMGCCYALLDRGDEAIDAVHMAITHGLQNREQLLREDTDLDSLRDTDAFRARIFPSVDANATRQQKWRADLDYLTQRMEETHFDVYRNISAEEWRAAADEIVSDAPELDDHEVHVRLMQLVTRVGDGHTAVRMPREGDDAFRFIPVRFYDYKDGLFVQSTAKEYEALVGGRLVRIGGVDADEAMARVATVTQRDNNQQVRWIAPRYMSIIEVLHGLGIAESMEYVDVTVNVDGEDRSLRVLPQPYTHVAGHGVIPNGVGMNNGADAALPLYLKDTPNNYWFEYLADEKMVYFQFNSVRNKDDESIADFADRLYAFVESNDVEALVIDVRLNHGGNNYLVEPIIRNTIRSDRINQRGRLFMIIGRETFSACQNFTNRMQARTNAMMVGEPTGSRPNFVGEGNAIQLPYSGVTVNASSRYWQDTRSDDYRVWVAPELGAELTSDDFRTNRDPAMEVIRAYLKTLKKESS